MPYVITACTSAWRSEVEPAGADPEFVGGGYNSRAGSKQFLTFFICSQLVVLEEYTNNSFHNLLY